MSKASARQVGLKAAVIISDGKLHDVNVLTFCSRNRAPFTSWTVAMWTSNACSPCIEQGVSSSSAPSPIPNMDRYLDLYSRRHHRETPRHQTGSLHNFADSEPDLIRENSSSSVGYWN